ncbi:MAG TPA: hypothetical protein VHV27_10160 [Phenylobacterium sp.]|nr:hypothetical protein [Phenylobacterium sp.]
MSARHGRILEDLAELGLGLARDLQVRALAAETAEQASDLSMAFHRVSRSVRQTLALEARLHREQLRHAEAEAIEELRQRPARAEQRRRDLHARVKRLIWTEREGDEAEDLLAELNDYLGWDIVSDDFLADPLEVHAARVAEELGLGSKTSTKPAAEFAQGRADPGHPPGGEGGGPPVQPSG